MNDCASEDEFFFLVTINVVPRAQHYILLLYGTHHMCMHLVGASSHTVRSEEAVSGMFRFFIRRPPLSLTSEVYTESECTRKIRVRIEITSDADANSSDYFCIYVPRW